MIRNFLKQENSRTSFEHPNLKVGKGTYGHSLIKFIDLEIQKVQIGNFCSIAGSVTIFLAGNHPMDQVTTYPFGLTDQMTDWKSDGYLARNQNLTNGPVIIGSDVWIGWNVTLMSGITVGDGSIIAANSHVVRDVLPYEVVGGNPAGHIKFRFNEATIDRLLKIKWWEWSESRIQSAQSLLSSTLTGEVITELELIGEG